MPFQVKVEDRRPLMLGLCREQRNLQADAVPVRIVGAPSRLGKVVWGKRQAVPVVPGPTCVPCPQARLGDRPGSVDVLAQDGRPKELCCNRQRRGALAAVVPGGDILLLDSRCALRELVLLGRNRVTEEGQRKLDSKSDRQQDPEQCKSAPPPRGSEQRPQSA